MRDFKIFLAFTAVSLVLAVTFFVYPEVLGPIPYGTFTFLFATVICFWVASRLTSQPPAGDEQSASLVKTMRNYFVVMGVFFFLDGIAHVGLPKFYPVDIVASHMHTFSHAFFFVGNAIIIRIPMSFINPRLKNAASFMVGVLGVVTIWWRLFHPDTLVSIAANLPPIIIADKTTGLLFAAVNAISLLIPGIYIMIRGLRSSPEIRTRALLLGLGMAIFFSIGPVIDLVKGPLVQLLIHILQAVSFFLMGASALYAGSRARESVPLRTL